MFVNMVGILDKLQLYIIMTYKFTLKAINVMFSWQILFKDVDMVMALVIVCCYWNEHYTFYVTAGVIQ